MSRKMSIRALNVVTMHRFSRGSITNAGDGTNFGQGGASFPPRPNQVQNKPSLLLRASSNLLKQSSKDRRSTLGRFSRMTINRISNLKGQKQGSIVSRDSTLDANLDIEEEEGIGIIGNMHRCSMIKKYSMETFFSPEKMHRRAFTASDNQALL